MFAFLTTTYLLPAIVLNPSVVVHIINTFYSHFNPPTTSVSHSPYPWFEKLGPVPGSTLFFDVHDHDRLVWAYTITMAFVQVIVFEWVKENRARMELTRKAKIEKEVDSKYGNEKLVGRNSNAHWKIIAFPCLAGATWAFYEGVLS